MSKLPSPADLAVLVSNVTGSMFGTTFVPAEDEVRGESLCQRMVMMRLTADREITLVLSSDELGSRSLSAAFLGCAPEKVTQEMIDDVIAELLNMIAGQIAATLDLNSLIGVPSPTTLGDLVQETGGLGAGNPILLRSQGEVDLGLWIFEAKSEEDEAPIGETSGGVVGSLIQRMVRPRPNARSR